MQLINFQNDLFKPGSAAEFNVFMEKQGAVSARTYLVWIYGFTTWLIFFFLFRKTAFRMCKPSHITKTVSVVCLKKPNQYILCFHFMCTWWTRWFCWQISGQMQVLTWHHETARSPEAPDPPVVCFPGNSSRPDREEPSCGGCAGWASEWAVQRALKSRCWSTKHKQKRSSGTMLIYRPTATRQKLICQKKIRRQRLIETSKRWLLTCVMK